MIATVTRRRSVQGQPFETIYTPDEAEFLASQGLPEETEAPNTEEEVRVKPGFLLTLLRSLSAFAA